MMILIFGLPILFLNQFLRDQRVKYIVNVALAIALVAFAYWSGASKLSFLPLLTLNVIFSLVAWTTAEKFRVGIVWPLTSLLFLSYDNNNLFAQYGCLAMIGTLLHLEAYGGKKLEILMLGLFGHIGTGLILYQLFFSTTDIPSWAVLATGNVFTQPHIKILFSVGTVFLWLWSLSFTLIHRDRGLVWIGYLFSFITLLTFKGLPDEFKAFLSSQYVYLYALTFLIGVILWRSSFSWKGVMGLALSMIMFGEVLTASSLGLQEIATILLLGHVVDQLDAQNKGSLLHLRTMCLLGLIIALGQLESNHILQSLTIYGYILYYIVDLVKHDKVVPQPTRGAHE